MELNEIIEALERPGLKFQREALEAAVEMREAVTPELLRILEDTLAHASEMPERDPDGEYFGHLYALFLLAQFRETRAYPLVVAFARLDQSLQEDLLGDFISESLCRVLASVCGGDTGPIEALVEDPSVYEYARDAALLSLPVLMMEGVKTRDEVMAYFKSLFEGRLEREESVVWSSLVATVVDLHPEELAGYIAGAFDDGLVDPGFVSRRAFEMALKRDKAATLEKLPGQYRGFIHDTVAELKGWACFDQPSRTPPRPAPSPREAPARTGYEHVMPVSVRSKTGRNDPCPCGSGKKFKKCCLNA